MSCYRNHRFYETAHGKELARSHSDQQNVDGEDMGPEGIRVAQGVPENDAKTKVASEVVAKNLAIAEKDPLPPLKMAVTKTASRGRPAARGLEMLSRTLPPRRLTSSAVSTATCGKRQPGFTSGFDANQGPPRATGAFFAQRAPAGALYLHRRLPTIKIR